MQAKEQAYGVAEERGPAVLGVGWALTRILTLIGFLLIPAMALITAVTGSRA